MRVYIGVLEISGFHKNLYNALKENGVDVEYHIIFPHKYKYGKENNNSLLANFLKKIIVFQRGKSLIIKGILYPFYFVCNLIYFVECLIKFDVFIFGFGLTILPNNIDLFILRIFGKKIFSFMCHGSEARPPFLDGSYQPSQFNSDYDYLKTIKDKHNLIYKRIRRHEKYATWVIGNINIAHYFKNNFINVLSIGIPKPKEELKKWPEFNFNKTKIKIVHAPSNTLTKGTKKIVKVIKKINKRTNFRIDLKLLINQPNEIVLSEIKKADFVFDQLYSDGHSSGLSIEAMRCSTPSIICGYELDRLGEFYDNKEILFPKTINLKVDNLYEELVCLFVDNQRVLDSINSCQKYLISNFSDKIISDNITKLIDNDIPKNWIINPEKCFIKYGYGLSKDQATHILELIKKHNYEFLFDEISSEKLKKYFLGI